MPTAHATPHTPSLSHRPPFTLQAEAKRLELKRTKEEAKKLKTEARDAEKAEKEAQKAARAAVKAEQKASADAARAEAKALRDSAKAAKQAANAVGKGSTDAAPSGEGEDALGAMRETPKKSKEEPPAKEVKVKLPKKPRSAYAFFAEAERSNARRHAPSG